MYQKNLKKNVLNIWESGDNTMKNKEQTNACYGCFGAANGDCDECDKDRSNKDEEYSNQ